MIVCACVCLCGVGVWMCLEVVCLQFGWVFLIVFEMSRFHAFFNVSVRRIYHCFSSHTLLITDQGQD